MPRSSHPRGFTLVEMLVALAITGMLAGMIFSSMQTLARGQERLSARDATQREMELALAWHADSASALTADTAYPFSGDSTQWQGVSLHPLAESHPHRTRVSWRLQVDDNGSRIGCEEAEGASLPPLRLHPLPARFGYLDAEGRLHSQWPPAIGVQMPLPEAIAVLAEEGGGRLLALVRVVRQSDEPWRALPGDDE